MFLLSQTLDHVSLISNSVPSSFLHSDPTSIERENYDVIEGWHWLVEFGNVMEGYAGWISKENGLLQRWWEGFSRLVSA